MKAIDLLRSLANLSPEQLQAEVKIASPYDEDVTVESSQLLFDELILVNMYYLPTDKSKVTVATITATDHAEYLRKRAQ